MAGGAPREVLDGVVGADFSPTAKTSPSFVRSAAAGN